MVGKSRVARSASRKEEKEKNRHQSKPYSKQLLPSDQPQKTPATSSGSPQIGALLTQLASLSDRSAERFEVINAILRSLAQCEQGQQKQWMMQIMEKITFLQDKKKRVIFSQLVSEIVDELFPLDLRALFPRIQELIQSTSMTKKAGVVLAIAGVVCSKRFYQYDLEVFRFFVSSLVNLLEEQKQSKSPLQNAILNTLLGTLCRTSPEQKAAVAKDIERVLFRSEKVFDALSLDLELAILSGLSGNANISGWTPHIRWRLHKFLEKPSNNFFHIASVGSENFLVLIFEILRSFFLAQSLKFAASEPTAEDDLKKAVRLIEQLIPLAQDKPQLFQNLVKTNSKWISENLTKCKELPSGVLRTLQRRFFETVQHKNTPFGLVSEFTELKNNFGLLQLGPRFATDSKKRNKLTKKFEEIGNIPQQYKTTEEWASKAAQLLTRLFQLLSLFCLVCPSGNLAVIEDLVDDAQQSLKELFGSSKNSDKSMPIGVLVDLCVALLTLSGPHFSGCFMRSVKKIFKALAPQISVENIQGLQAALLEDEEEEMELEEDHLGDSSASDDSSDSDDSDSEEDDDFDDDSDSDDLSFGAASDDSQDTANHIQNNNNNNNNNNNSNSESESSDEQEEEKLFPIVQKNEDSESEWSDDTMLRQDHLLAEVVRQKLQANGEKTNETEFLERILELLKVVLKNAHPNSDLQLEILRTFLKADQIHASTPTFRKKIGKALLQNTNLIKNCQATKSTPQIFSDILDTFWIFPEPAAPTASKSKAAKNTLIEQNLSASEPIFEKRTNSQLCHQVCLWSEKHQNQMLKTKISLLFAKSLETVMSGNTKHFSFVVPQSLIQKKNKNKDNIMVQNSALELFMKNFPWIGQLSFQTLLELIEKKDFPSPRFRPASWLVFGTFVHHQLLKFLSLVENNAMDQEESEKELKTTRDFLEKTFMAKQVVGRFKAAFKDYFESISEYDGQILLSVGVIFLSAVTTLVPLLKLQNSPEIDETWFQQLLASKTESKVKKYFKKLKATYCKLYLNQ